VNSLEITALTVIAAWLGVLTLASLLLVRQVGLLTVRLNFAGQDTDDGLPIGTPLPAEVTSRLPELDQELAYLLFVAPTCGPCVDLVRQLAESESNGHNRNGIGGHRTLAFLPGADDRAEELASRVPVGMRKVRDPDATSVAKALHVRTTPFALQVERGIIAGKARVKDAAELQSFIETYAVSDAAEIAKSIREVIDSAR
jgi:hypothetical protein